MDRRGFTLIEMMIVIAIIAILAAVALPNMLGSRKAAAERAAMSELRTIGTAAEAYYVREGEYPGSASTFLASLASNEFLPGSYSSAGASYTKGGYNITVSSASADEYNIEADPTSERKGNKCYRVITGGTLYQANYSSGSCSGWEQL